MALPAGEPEPVGWRAYFADGDTFTFTEPSAWEDLPGEGLVGVVEFLTPPYRRIVDGGDWYWMDEAGRVQKSGTRWGGRVEVPEEARGYVISGAGLADDEYEQIAARMDADRDWPEAA